VTSGTVGEHSADAVLARVARQRDLVAAMDEQCRSISARVSSRDGAVSAQVDGYGALTGLWLGDTAHRHSATELETLIIETAHAAARVGQERLNHLMAEFTRRFSALRADT
jgi:DNA-binding protein YbaB